MAMFNRKLRESRIVLSGETIYALFPIPSSFCSDHPKIKNSNRDINSIAMHLCSKQHLNLMKTAANGLTVAKNLQIIAICGICNIVPNSIVGHFINYHQGQIFSTSTAIDLINVLKSRDDARAASSFADSSLSAGLFSLHSAPGFKSDNVGRKHEYTDVLDPCLGEVDSGRKRSKQDHWYTDSRNETGDAKADLQPRLHFNPRDVQAHAPTQSSGSSFFGTEPGRTDGMCLHKYEQEW